MAQKVLDSLNVKDLTGKNGLVVFFFPKAMSGPCSLEVNEFNERLDHFKELGFNVVGVSLDKNEKNEKFCQREDLKFPLVSDKTNDATTKYGHPGMLKVAGMPVPFTHVAQRSAVILDPTGKVLFEIESIGNKNFSIKQSVSILLDKLAEFDKQTNIKTAAVNKGIKDAEVKSAAAKAKQPVKKPAKKAADKASGNKKAPAKKTTK